jgi:tape measure domain-containing protein
MAFTVDIRGNASHLEKTLGLAKGRIMELGNVAKTSVAGLAGLGLAGAAGLGAFIVTSSQAAASIEDLGIQFEVLTGSAQKSKELLAQFREEEKKSALSTQDYAEGAKLLLANNVEYKSLMPILRMIGDVSLGNAERFGRLSLAMAQISAKGKLAGGELNQLAESGFNPLQIIAEKTGKSYEELFKLMEARKVTVAHVMTALKSATSEGGRFYQAINKGSAGTTAKINQTKAAVTQLQVAFGTGFNEGLKDALDATNNFLPQLEVKFTEVGDIIGSAISKSVQGNTAELAAVGAFMGEVVFNGFKAFYLKGFDELMAASGNQLMNSFYDPTGIKRSTNTMRRASQLPDQFNLPDPYQSPTTMSYVQTALEEAGQSQNLQFLKNAEMQRQVELGIKNGIDASMSEAVKKGVLEANSRQPGGARYSN